MVTPRYLPEVTNYVGARHGVCIYITNAIPFSHIHNLVSDDLELLCCDLLLPKSKPSAVGICYRPPKQNDFIEKLEEEMFKIRTNSDISFG